MRITEVISTAVDVFRFIKFRMSANNIGNMRQAAPFGVDSNPIAGLKAIYSDTSLKGKGVIIGYLNESNLTDEGETRLYSMNSEGELQTYILLKADGVIELAGNSHNAVRYTPLNTAIQSFKTALQTELGLIASGIAAGGGSYTPGLLSIDISASKIDEIKTI